MPAPQQKEKKISLNIKQVATPPPAPKPKAVTKPLKQPVKPQPVVKPVVKPVKKPVEKPVEKKVVEKKPQEEVKRVALDESKKTFAVKSRKENNVTKAVKKKPKKVVKKKVEKKKVVKKKPVKKKRVVKRKPQKQSKDPLANFLMGSGSGASQPTQRRSGRGNFAQKMINELYGSEFNTYTPTQKKYIKNNLSTIHQITQRELTRNGYPEVAVRTRQQGTNVVSFYLHPNGDITGLRLKKRMGYAALDDNTIEVIRTAYKKYPLPNQKTRLLFYVNYSLY